MTTKELLADIGIGAISGYFGTKVMEPVTMKLYQWESKEAREQEKEVRPGPPYQIAARKSANLVGINLSDQQVKMVGLLFHMGIGVAWGVVYPLLRRWTNVTPLWGGLLTGASMSLIIDEALTPLLGFSAPNRAYPLVTHIRGIVAHLVFGLAVAAMAEMLDWFGRAKRSDRRFSLRQLVS